MSYQFSITYDLKNPTFDRVGLQMSDLARGTAIKAIGVILLLTGGVE